MYIVCFRKGCCGKYLDLIRTEIREEGTKLVDVKDRNCIGTVLRPTKSKILRGIEHAVSIGGR
jgi:hypothetical protein